MSYGQNICFFRRVDIRLVQVLRRNAFTVQALLNARIGKTYHCYVAVLPCCRNFDKQPTTR